MFMSDEKNEVEEQQAQDLSPQMRAQAAAPKKTWFFLRGDGKMIICEEREAWDIVHNHSEWKRRDFKLIGVSDGTTYQQIIKTSINDAKVLEPQIEKLKAELKKYERAEEKLLIDEVVDMEGDPTDTVNEANKAKVLRLRKIIDRIDEQLEVVEKQYRAAVGGVVARATAAELEKARGNIEWPGDVNYITPNADPKQRRKILKLMNAED